MCTGDHAKERDIYYGSAADISSFMKLPKALLKDPVYKELSIEGIVLYSAMLDRMCLSIAKNWADENGRIFIYYKLEEIMGSLRCCKGKAVNVLKELEAFGLIEKKRQGCNEPSRIYVLSINRPDDLHEEDTRAESIESAECINNDPPEVQNKNFRKYEDRTTESTKKELPGVQKTHPINTEYNNTKPEQTKTNKTEISAEISILPSIGWSDWVRTGPVFDPSEFFMHHHSFPRGLSRSDLRDTVYYLSEGKTLLDEEPPPDIDSKELEEWDKYRDTFRLCFEALCDLLTRDNTISGEKVTAVEVLEIVDDHIKRALDRYGTCSLGIVCANACDRYEKASEKGIKNPMQYMKACLWTALREPA